MPELSDFNTEYPVERFNPFAGNKFETRQDVADATNALIEPLIPAFSPGGARVQLDCSAAHFTRPACDLEGWARPLWAIVPYVAGGGKFDHWETYRRGLVNGTNPDHPEYWGEVRGVDQIQVELAVVGAALTLTKEHIWDPLADSEKAAIIKYLVHSRNHEYAANNWRFFRVLLDVGLESVGFHDFDKSMTEKYLDEVDSYYISGGWYRDGSPPGDDVAIDYYNPFALHFYGLVYAKMRAKQDPKRVKAYKERALEFLKDFAHWFDADGACVPFGRSLTYRFACGAFWGGLGLAFDDADSLPWGQIKGLYLRHWRWWARQPICDLDRGVLTVGYAYPNRFMSEAYNSSQSPYWALKMSFALMLPESHPFWQAKEEPLDFAKLGTPLSDGLSIQKTPGAVISHDAGHTVMLVSGPRRLNMRHIFEKYGKFAYSTRYGFSVESDAREFLKGVFDSMIGFSDDNMHFRVRHSCDDVRMRGGAIYSKWHPWDDVDVETFLIPKGAWHIRAHRIKSPRKLYTIEGGFAIPRPRYKNETVSITDTSVTVEGVRDISIVADLGSTVARKPRSHAPDGNTNIMFPNTVVPQLLGEVPANQAVTFACAVLATPDKAGAAGAISSPPKCPTDAELDDIIKGEQTVLYATRAAI